MNIYEPTFLEENRNLNLQCSNCKELIMCGGTTLLEINTAELKDEKLSAIIEEAASKIGQEHIRQCNGKVSISPDQFLLFIYFKEPKNIQIPLNFNLLGQRFKYKSHIREVQQKINCNFETHFVHEDIQYVSDDGVIKLSSSTDFEKDVCFLILSREKEESKSKEVTLFSNNAINSIRNKASLITNPEKNLQLLQKRKEKDKETGRRIEIEAKRKEKDEETGRRKDIESKRYLTPKRKKANQRK